MPRKASWGADNAWEDMSDVPKSMESLYIMFASLGGISARFAVRLAEAGALTALMRLDAKQREHCGQAAGCGADEGTRNNAALHNEAAVDCIAVYARSVPQVSCRADAAGSTLCAPRLRLGVWKCKGLGVL